MNDQLLDLLACPRCHAAFASFADFVRCTGCGAKFPVIGDIPRLNDGATERDPKVAAEWEAQLHAHALYADRQSIVNRLEEQVLPRLVEWLGTVTPPILDVGCGVGHFGRTWAASGRATVPLLGIDLQVRLLADAQSGYVGLVEGDVHRLPLREASFGAVVFANALHHVSEPVRALEQVKRVLRPGGVVVTCDPREVSVVELAKKILRRNSDAFTEYHRAFRPAAYRGLFDQAGLDVERLEVVDPFGPLLATGLDLIKAGRLGIVTPVAKVLAGMDRMAARADPTRRFGLIVLARARRGAAVPEVASSATMPALRERLPRVLSSPYLQAPLVLFLHALLMRSFFGFCQLRPEAYFQPIIVATLWQHPETAAFLTLNVGLLAAFRRRLGWKAIDPEGRTRLFVFLVAAIMAWAFSTYSMNLYLGQAHYYDRLILLFLLALILVHPAFVVLFTGVLLMIALQLQYPLPGAVAFWPDKRLPVDCLILFNAFLLGKLVTRPRRDTFLFLVLCLTGASYSNAAILKMRLGPQVWSWLVDNRISNLIVSSYTNAGWLWPLGDARVATLAASVAPADIVSTAATLLIELSGFAILLTRRLTRPIVVGFILLHVAILVSSGVFFWKWILFDLALLWYHRRSEMDARAEAAVEAAAASAETAPDAAGSRRWRWQLYRPSRVFLALLVIAGTERYFYNIDFAWFDSKLANYFVLYGVGESGERYRLDPRFFAPYDMLFVQSRFYYLLPRPALVGTYGTSRSYEVAQALERASVADVPRLRELYGRTVANRRLAARFAAFVQRYVERAQQREGRRLWIHRLAPPFHFQTMEAAAYRFQERLAAIEVEFEERLFDGRAIRLVGREPVMTIEFGQARPGAP